MRHTHKMIALIRMALTLSPTVGWVSVFCVTHQRCVATQYALVNECLAARLVGYGTNGVPNPPYIGYGTAFCKYHSDRSPLLWGRDRPATSLPRIMSMNRAVSSLTPCP